MYRMLSGLGISDYLDHKLYVWLFIPLSQGVSPRARPTWNSVQEPIYLFHSLCPLPRPFGEIRIPRGVFSLHSARLRCGGEVFLSQRNNIFISSLHDPRSAV